VHKPLSVNPLSPLFIVDNSIISKGNLRHELSLHSHQPPAPPDSSTSKIDLLYISTRQKNQANSPPHILFSGRLASAWEPTPPDKEGQSCNKELVCLLTGTLFVLR